MFRDPRGVPLTAGAAATVDAFETLIADILGFAGDPVRRARQLREEDPACVLARLAEAALFAWSLQPGFARAAGHRLGELRTDLGRAGERERLFAAAIDDWLAGRLRSSRRRFDLLLDRWPGDLLALFFAHQADFFAGGGEALRARPARVLEAIGPKAPLAGFVSGMRAFGEEEAGNYGLALDLGRRAVESRPRDVWAIHAVAHVFEETGQGEAGIAWYRDREPDWAENSLFACHNAWHLALYHLSRGEQAAALAVYDRHLRPHRRSILLNFCDAISFLWRLQLAGGDPGDRAAELAAPFDAAFEPGQHPFVDVHALFLAALLGDARRLRELDRQLRALAAGSDERARMTARAVLPVAGALAARLAEDFAACARHLDAAGGGLRWMTGSRAQRRILDLTRADAARRAGLAPPGRGGNGLRRDRTGTGGLRPST